MTNLVIIGAGNMGGAIVKGLKEAGCCKLLAVSDVNQEKLDALNLKRTSTNPDAILPDAEVVLFAIKPQQFDECVNGLSTSLEEKMIVSIMAGVTIERIREKTGSQKIVRTMPNLGAFVGKSMTTWVATKEVTDEEKIFIRCILQSIGEEMELDDEAMINAATVIAGSGPAYFFFLAEILTHEAEKLGFSSEQARQLSEMTLIASARLLETGEKDAQAWREAVSSKGGVTEKAIDTMRKEGLEELFHKAIEEAKQRCTEL